MKIITNLLRAFDFYERPMAELNLHGETRYRSKCGGCCGLIASLLILWFFLIKTLKMMRRLDANSAEVNEGLDLMAPDAQLYGF
jgi:hypothetical protein